MPTLHDIPGIGDSARELLDAAGIRDAKHLSEQIPEQLLKEIKRANETLSITKRTPGLAIVRKWIAGAVKLDSEHVKEEIAPAVPDPVNYEGNPEVMEMLEHAPCAIPLPGNVMLEKKLSVSDIPAGLLLSRYSGDLDVRIGDGAAAPKTDVPSRRTAGRTERFEGKPQQQPFDPANVKAAIPSKNVGKRVPKSKEGHEDDRVALIRAPREKTNRGKDPNSRRYIRGVLHTHPWSLRIGAVLSLILIIDFPLAIASALLLLIAGENSGSFEWVPKWILAFPLSLPIIGIGYMFWGLSGKCRICTQKLFVHKGALKHVKSHRLPGFGYVVPLCLHLLFFSWFRCSSCGTPVRLKK